MDAHGRGEHEKAYLLEHTNILNCHELQSLAVKLVRRKHAEDHLHFSWNLNSNLMAFNSMEP